MGILYKTPPADVVNQLERAGLVDHTEAIEQEVGYRLGRRIIFTGIAAGALLTAALQLELPQHLSDRLNHERSVQTGPPSEELGRVAVEAAEQD
jgi:hypothetical protein